MTQEPQSNPGPLIEFHAGGHERFPPPYPASRNIPEWYKKLSLEVSTPQEQANRTLKRCAPFLDALSCGYIIPLCGDITFTTDAQGNLSFEVEATANLIETHGPVQYAGTPFAAALIVKFINLWLVKTPPGYSTLFIAPMNRFHIPFMMLSGVVDTDNYYREIHFPAICQLPHNARYEMKRGTPLMQAIPFPREEWSSVAQEWDKEQRGAVEHQIAANLHLYKDEHWQKKTYG
jgi:hypothetical protein